MTKQDQSNLNPQAAPQIEPERTEVADTYWGVCEWCGKHDGYVNIGPLQFYFCHAHRSHWQGGRNTEYHRENEDLWFRNACVICDYDEAAPEFPDVA